MGKPRISEADYLQPEDLLDGSVRHEWVRIPAYSEGHLVSKVGHTAVCGKPLLVDEYWWDSFQAALRIVSHFANRAKGNSKWSPSEWYIARDRRKGSKCSQCEGAKDTMFEDVPKRNETFSYDAAMAAPFVDPTPADKLLQVRFNSQVARVARELGAVVVNGPAL